jgi:hypothetical protein
MPPIHKSIGKRSNAINYIGCKVRSDQANAADPGLVLDVSRVVNETMRKSWIMTARAAITQVMLTRAAKVAKAQGMAVLVRDSDIFLAPVEALALPSPKPVSPTEGNSCDKAFGT